MEELWPIKLQPKNKEEEYILDEARAFLKETMFLSYWVPNSHVDNVVKLGKKNTKFLIEFAKENNHKQGMYSHFILDVLYTLYKDDIKVEGYLGVSGCMNLIIKMYEKELLKDD